MQAFPKIFAIGTPYIRDIFQTPVEVTEKLDGSQFAFTFNDMELRFRSKGNSNGVDGMFTKGVDSVVKIHEEHFLEPFWIYYGEYFQKPKHNTLAYDRIPPNHIALFGIQIEDGTFLNYDDVHEEANRLGLGIVNRIYEGYVTKDMLEGFLEQDSALGGCKIEGVVIKNHGLPCKIGDQYFPITCGKYVSEHFKEVHRHRWGCEETSKGKLQTFFESFKSLARWEKAIFHMRDNGTLTETPKDIGELMRYLNNDIETEEKDAIKEWLYLHFRRDLLKCATNGFPEWYKERIMSLSFKGEADESNEAINNTTSS